MAKSLIDSNNLHHVYFLVGSSYKARTVVDDVLKNLNVKTNSPDVFNQNFTVFGINDSKRLRQMQSQTALSGQKKFYILEIDFITIEAQNALLKTLEEPTAGSHIFLICRSEDSLIPTVKSRCQIVTLERDKAEIEKSLAAEFLALDTFKRLEFIKNKFNFKDDEIKSELLDFLDDLEALLAVKIHQAHGYKVALELSVLLATKKKIYRRGTPLKSALEEVAVALAG